MESPSPRPLVLPARLDMSQAEGLRHALMARKGQALNIDAGSVAHLGALCLQILIAAALDWQSQGLRLQITPRSAAFNAATAVFAVPLSWLQSEVRHGA